MDIDALFDDNFAGIIDNDSDDEYVSGEEKEEESESENENMIIVLDDDDLILVNEGSTQLETSERRVSNQNTLDPPTTSVHDSTPTTFEEELPQSGSTSTPQEQDSQDQAMKITPGEVVDFMMRRACRNPQAFIILLDLHFSELIFMLLRA